MVDYQMCMVFLNRETDVYEVKEQEIDSKENQTYWVLVETGFSTRDEAENWLMSKRSEQVVNELLNVG